MSLVDVPLERADTVGSGLTAPTVRAMEVGQHIIAIALTAIGVVRAIGDGVSLPAAMIAGVAVLAWHTAGSIMLIKTRSQLLAVWWLIGFAVVWGAAVAVSAEFVWLAFLLWLLAGHLLPMLWGALFSVVILAVVTVAPVLHHGTTNYPTVFGPMIGGIFAFGISRGYLQLLRDAAERERLVTSLTRTQQEMSELQDELAITQRHAGVIAERTRVSRDIHDTVAQSISSVRLLAHAGRNRTNDADAAHTLTQVETLASDSLVDVRRIIAELAPAELEDNALTAALQRMLDRFHEQTGVSTDYHVDDSLPLLPTEVEVALLRTAQSALANVRLHASATRVVMSLIDADDSVRLDIIDDGVGFDPVTWDPLAGAGISNFGLRFMRSRLRELGGGLDIESAPGDGTAISAHAPFYRSPGDPQSKETE